MEQEKSRQKQGGVITRILDFAQERKVLTYIGCILVGVSMIFQMLPYIYIWRIVDTLIQVAPNWSQAGNIVSYGWRAFACAVVGIVLYFAGLLCTHMAAFRVQTNIRKRSTELLMHAPLGYFGLHASGWLRRRIDGASTDSEQLLAHNLADISGTIVMFIATLIILFIYDWRMGLACFAAAIISVACMFAMMGGNNANLMSEYQDALDEMSKAGTEYVRGIPVVKVFQQTVYSFRAFKAAIDAYSDKAERYQGEVCEIPQSINLTFTEAAFILLVPVALFIAPRAIAADSFVRFVTDFAFYAIFSAIISTALAKVMFASGGMMQAQDALHRVEAVLDAPQLSVPQSPKLPNSNDIVFDKVSFAYEGSDVAALDNLSFEVAPGTTLALVGPSGGGKTTAASLIPRFWDVSSGSVCVGGVDVREMDPRVLMDMVAFVFQNSRLFKQSIFDNVRAARPEATREQVLEALATAQCNDIIAKLPDGIDTLIGTHGTYLSGGEHQRIALARAILKDAPIVVLDEATAFADPENEMLIQKALSKLTEDKTVVMVAHRLSTVVGADKIIVLDEGRLVEEGTHTQLVDAGGLYARMWADYQQALTWKIAKEVA